MPKNIFQDPRYEQFVEQFSGSALRFAVQVCGMVPSEDQVLLLEEITDPVARVSVVSGTGTGKTATFGRIALWHLLCFPLAVYDNKVEIGSNTYIGAPLVSQVADGVWKEMSDTLQAIQNGEYAWICQYFKITKTKVYVLGYENQWFISQIALAKGQAIGVAGKHRYWQLVIIDEAAGVPDDHFNVIDGTQTQAGNRTLMASQGARNSGRFYDSHHSLRRAAGGQWANLCFSSEASPFTTTAWLKARAFESGGRDSIEYRIRCRGQFADNSANNLLNRDELERAFKPRKLIDDDEPYGLVVLADVAMGEYRDDSVCIVAKIIGNEDQGEDARRVEFLEIPIKSNAKDEIDFAGDLQSIVGKLSNATLYVDAGGIGHSVCKLIEKAGGQVERINWGQPCFKKEFKERYFNLRACAMVRFRDAVRQGRVLLPQGLEKKVKEEILSQGSRLPYHFTESGGLRYVMMAKEKMREEGLKSPDLIDCLSFAFLEGCNYIPADRNTGTNAKAKEETLKGLSDSLDDALGDLDAVEAEA